MIMDYIVASTIIFTAVVEGRGILQLGAVTPSLPRQTQHRSLRASFKERYLQSCSTDGAKNYGNPESGRCMATWVKNNDFKYPEDFEGILNDVKIYKCETSQKRIIVSNGIPDHDVTMKTNNFPCEKHWHVSLPLTPIKINDKKEPPKGGIIAMTLNGVPAYGALEMEDGNAVEPATDGIPDAKFWYGHATQNNVWHFHHPDMGAMSPVSETLLGYALDGFPIYGPLDDASGLDSCNGITDSQGNYQYHVRTLDQVDESLDYCNEWDPAVNWKYIIGCYHGTLDDTVVGDSSVDGYTIPNDCIVEHETLYPYKRPNIIVMQPDDFPFFDEWTSPPNNPSMSNSKENNFPNNYEMPHIEGLRKTGLQMMQAYTASAKCGTSRYSTITGKYASRSASSRKKNKDNTVSEVSIPTTKLTDEDDGKDCTEENLAAMLKTNGYRTGVVGKWHLHKIQSGEYTYSSAVDDIKQCGFDFADGIFVENFNDGFSDGSFSHNMEWITSEAINFMNDKVTFGDLPFFLYFNPTVPHASMSVKDALNDFSCLDTAKGELLSEPMIKGMTSEYGNCKAYRDSIFTRAGGLESNSDLGAIWVDDSVGALLQNLDDDNELDNTIFIFQIDHGMEAKASLYENGGRISQFIHYPQSFGRQGMTFNGLVSTIDIAATIMDFADIDKNSDGFYKMDGKSWRHAIGDVDETSKWKNERCLLFEMGQDRAIRCGCNKHINIYNEATSVTVTSGQSKGFPIDAEMQFNLCAVDTTDYIIYPNANPEAINTIGSNPELDSDLSDALECFYAKTSPQSIPDFDTICAAIPGGALPTTPPPIQASTLAPSHAPSQFVCEDTSSRFPLTGTTMTRNCAWVAIPNKIDIRCAKYEDYCPVTCGLCVTTD